jgi:hypothetical protein
MALTKIHNRMVSGAVISVIDYGAVGDGSADDTSAINAALAAASSGDAVYFPTGNYKITSQITFNTNNVCIFGEGSTQTIITYAGASTTNDIFLMGDGVNALKNLALKGIRITSTVTMTDGFAFHFRRIVRSFINDVIIEGQDGNTPSKIYSGFWFNGLDDVQITQFRITPLAEGMRINGIAGVGVPKAGMFINDGKITGGTTGVRVSGAFGGLYINMVDIIAMSAAGIKIDTDTVAENNREIFLGPTCVIDSVSSGYGIHVTDALGGGQTLQMTGTWIASCSSHGLFMNGATTYVVTMAGCVLFNNGGDGVRVDNTNPYVSISGSTIRNSGGFGVNGGVNSNRVSISGCRMFSNASGDMADYSGMLAAISQVGQFVKEVIIGETVATTTGRKLTLETGLNTELAKITTVNAGFSNTSLFISAPSIASGTGYDFITAGNASGVAFRVRGDGTIFADVGTISSPADYAEMFEWLDGNPSAEDRVGCTVSLIGNKIKIAEAGDNVIGVVSGAPMIVGDAAPMRWQSAHLKDDFNRVLLEDYEVVEWIEHDAGQFHVEFDEMGKQQIVVDREGGEIVRSYASDAIPSNVTIPDDATKVTLQRPTENPEWDKETIYQPRTERKEWSAIGLVGKLRIKAGQVTNPNWIKMKNITDSVEEWLIK